MFIRLICIFDYIKLSEPKKKNQLSKMKKSFSFIIIIII